MIGRTKSVILTVCAGALVLGASGCTASADPLPSASPPTASASQPSQSATASAKPTPTPVPASSKGPAQNWPVPKMPEAAKEKSEKGIVAFTEYWFDLLEYMYVTNDTRQIKKVTNPECELCARKFIDPADGLNKNLAWSVGGQIDVEVTLAVMQGLSGAANFRLEQKELVVYSKDGDYYGKMPGTTEPDLGALSLSYDKGWRVSDLRWLDGE